MKRLLTFFTLLLLVVSCNKEVDVSQGEMSGDAVSFTASVVDATSSKATLINSWSGGEEVALFVDGDATVYHLTIAADGTMSGDDVIADRVAENTYTAFYPYDETLSTIEAYESACTAGNVDYMIATTFTSALDVTLQFSHQMAALSFTILIESTATNPTISLAVDGDFGSAATLEVETTTGTYASKLVANYFVEAGADLSSAMIKLGYSTTTSYISFAQDNAITLEVGKQYPFSYTANSVPTGSGTTSDPYIVYFADDMRKVGTDTDGWALSSHYILAWDIDLGSVEFTAIGTNTSSFTGTFDGGGHEISGLYIDQADTNYQGLFGYIKSATIKNLGVSGSVTGDSKVGGVVGYSNYSSSVSNCYFAGSVTGEGDVGGVVGYNYSGSSVSNCYNTGSVVGTFSNVGGVVGDSYYNSSSVSNCYNIGSVSGTSSNIGGVVGKNNSSSTVSNCYYLDTAFSGGNGVGYDGGTVETVSSKTAEEMQAADFVTLLNGDDGSSWMSDYATPINNGYPILSWQTSNN